MSAACAGNCVLLGLPCECGPRRGRPAFRPCGTLAAYRRHRRHGEKPCQACQEAHNAYNRDWMRARRRAEAEAFWRARDEAAEAAYQASVEAWRAEHAGSAQRQHERAVRTLVALLAEACRAA